MDEWRFNNSSNCYGPRAFEVPTVLCVEFRFTILLNCEFRNYAKVFNWMLLPQTTVNWKFMYCVYQSLAKVWNYSSNDAKLQQFPGVAWLYCYEWHSSYYYFTLTCSVRFLQCSLLESLFLDWNFWRFLGIFGKVWKWAILDYFSNHIWFYF